MKVRADASTLGLRVVSYVVIAIFCALCLIPFIALLSASFSNENSILLNGEGVHKRRVALETDPEKLSRLQSIWIEYQKKLGETVFSV